MMIESYRFSSHLMHLRLLCPTYKTSGFPFISRLFSRQSSFLGKMKHRKNTVNSAVRHENVVADESSRDLSKQTKSVGASDPTYEKEFPSLSATISHASKGKRRIRIDLGTQLEKKLDEESGYAGSLKHVASSMSQQDEFSLPTSFGKKHVPHARRPKLHQTYPKHVMGIGTSNGAEKLPVVEPFDICLSNSSKSFVPKHLLHEEYMDTHIENVYPIKETRQILRPGMVLLANYMSLSEQVEIIQKCQELGLGPGGFYQPGYLDGAKLRLRMMCLGMNWDPQTKYEERLRNDDFGPPAIPPEFILFVKKALLDSHALITRHRGASNVEEILPGMSPDICIVNFYTTNGRLGLHQDRDESRESLRRGLPVVSFSVGDSAEFLYGDKRDIDKAERVLLQSGDVLIFGGMSRHIFHGVTSIIPNSAPPVLLKEAKLRPGRLNLTFRQF